MRSTALQERLASIPVLPDATEREVQLLVWAFVDDRKAAGWLPEHIIAAFKQITREAGLTPSPMVKKDVEEWTTVDAFLIEMIDWCIHRYFHPE
jgi:hypothetical protein